MKMKNISEYALSLAGIQLIIQFYLLQQLLLRSLPAQTILIITFNIIFIALVLGGLFNKNPSFADQILVLTPFQVLFQLILVLSLPALSVFLNSLIDFNFNYLSSALINLIILVLISLSSTAAISASFRQGTIESDPSSNLLSILTGILLGLLMIVLLTTKSIQLYLLFYALISAALLAALQVNRLIIYRFTGVCLVIIAIFPLLNRQINELSYGIKYAQLGAGAAETYKYTVNSKYDLLPVGDHDQLLIVNGITKISLAEVQRDQDLLLTYAESFLQSPSVCLINQPYLTETDAYPESINLVHEDRNIPEAIAWSLKSLRIPERNFINIKPAKFIQQDDFKYDLVIYNDSERYLHPQPDTNSTYIKELHNLVNNNGMLAVKLTRYGGSNRFILEKLADSFNFYFAIQLHGALYFFAGDKLTVADDEYQLRRALKLRYHNQSKLYTRNQVDRHFLGMIG